METVSPKVKADWSRSGEFVSDDDEDTVPVMKGSRWSGGLVALPLMRLPVMGQIDKQSGTLSGIVSS